MHSSSPADAVTRHATPDPVAWLLALALFVVAVMWSALYFVLDNDRRNAQHQAEINLGNLARAFAEHTGKTLEGADQAVRFVRSEFLRQGTRLDINDYIRSQALIDDDYHLLTVIGADGQVVTSTQPFSRVDLREREHFKMHAQGHADRLYVSKPVLGKVSGKWSVQITRRVDDRLGQFAGVVVVSMPPGYFTRFFGEVDLGAHGLTSLVGLDGVVRTRASRAGAEQGQDVSASVVYRAVKEHRNGVIRDRSVIDGIDRLYAYRALQHHDLYVVTAMGMDDVYAEPDQRARVWLATALAVTAVIGVFTLNIVRRSRARSRLMAELSASQVRAEAANRLKSKFLASVSHELRTPLNGILGYAELVRDTSTDEEAREFGGVIHSSAQHLHQLVNTILDLAKIESGHLVIQPAPTALPALLSEVQHLHAVHARQRGTQLLLALDEACPADITTDRTRLLQVLTNIVNNAIKFTEDGTITLGARPERGGVLLGVTDTGVGIAPERLDQLFERFHAVSARWGMAGQGAGLGLPLAKELTERLGGRLALSSRPGQGTQVTIWLPLVAPATAESPVQPAAV